MCAAILGLQQPTEWTQIEVQVPDGEPEVLAPVRTMRHAKHAIPHAKKNVHTIVLRTLGAAG